MDKLAIGIDLGTTYTCVAVFRNNQVEVIPNSSGKLTTPSFVSFTDDGILAGEEAKDNFHTNVKNTVYETKRLIGQKYDDPKVQSDINKFQYTVIEDMGYPKIRVVHNGEVKEYSPEEICSHLLNRVKVTAQEYLGCIITRAVITIPAYFNMLQRKATIDAAKIAGFETINIINEPTSAALAFNYKNQKDYQRNILVYDFGGGTFDVSIVAVEKGTCTVLATDGDCHLGGTDIDAVLSEYFKQDFKEKFKRNMTESDDVDRRLKSCCEKIKEKLSAVNCYQASVELYVISGEDYVPSLSRARFEEITAQIFKKTLDIVKNCLKASKVEKENIDELILIGGSSRIPKVQELLREHFPNIQPNKTINPDEAVAYGAAIYAHQLIGDKSEIQDVTSLSLGTNTTNDEMSFIIPRNTPIPATANKKYRTVKDNQPTMEIPIFQGERTIASENYAFEHFTMTGLTLGPAGTVSVDIQFDITEEGLLRITANEVNSDNKKVLTFDTKQGGLSQEQINRKLQEAEKYREEDSNRKKVNNAASQFEKLCIEIEKCTTWRDATSKKNVWKALETTQKWLQGINKSTTDPKDVHNKTADLKKRFTESVS